ncbi:MAG: WD40/YVTN/BNR-like repeat-containing protein, partial [Terriglobales bacterium]
MRNFVGILALGLAVVAPAAAQAPNPLNTSYYTAMRWRLIGPYRAGRVSAVSGVASDPNLYFIGTPGGGVWKTTDGGVVWQPVLDKVGAASIGAIAIAPSQPATVYAGSGEQLPGDGMYVTHDSGRSWRHAGLVDTRTIDAIWVDPHNPLSVLAAAATGVTGVYRTVDGGANWKRTLSVPAGTGVVSLGVAPDDPQVVYAATQAGRAGALYRSDDGGLTWKPLAASGLPLNAAGKAGLAVAPQSRGGRVYAYLTPGLFESTDGGASWQRTTTDPRVTGGGYFCQIYVDPNHPQVIYAVETSLYRSTDGGHTFAAFRGAPGGDDYHVMWIDPADSRRIILGVDQGATISVDGGRSWSVWFNQPTAQLYRVSVDSWFPFYMYSSQQDSGGTLALPNRSDYGSISAKDWYSTGGNENAYSAPDPLDPNLVYTNGWYGNVVRFDRHDGQVLTVFAAGDRYRLASPAPIVFSPTDPHRLYLGTQYLLATDDGGAYWRPLGGDLTAGAAAPASRG